MRDEAIDLCGQVDFTRTDAMPLLERDTQFHFACAGCGNCCRGREDIVLSGYDLWRIAARAASAAADRSPGLLPQQYWQGEPFTGAAACPGEGKPQQLPLSDRKPLRHP